MVNVSPEARQKALESVLAGLNKKYGGSSEIAHMSDIKTNIDRFSSGSVSLDYLVGSKTELGIPRGRVVTFYGPSSGGKTTLALYVAKAVQKSGGTVAVIDLEATLTEDYMRALGLDPEQIIFSRPETAEIATEMIVRLAESGAVDLIILDSVNALVPADYREKSMDEHTKMAGVAGLVTRLLQTVTMPLSNSNTTLLLIGQTRANLNPAGPFDKKEILSGGQALRFYSSIILRVARKGSLKRGDETYGSTVLLTTEKNKTASPDRRAELDIIFGSGVSREHELIDMGVRYKVIKKSGAWFSYDGENIGQGKAGTADTLRENPALADAIEEEIRREAGLGKDATEYTMTKADEIADSIG